MLELPQGAAKISAALHCVELDKGQTAFRLSLSSAGAPAGLYTVAFTGADGQALGSVTFTVR